MNAIISVAATAVNHRVFSEQVAIFKTLIRISIFEFRIYTDSALGNIHSFFVHLRYRFLFHKGKAHEAYKRYEDKS